MTRVLLIEVSATLRLALEKVLVRSGYEVKSIGAYAEALSTLNDAGDDPIYEALVIGWPAKTDSDADELIAALDDNQYEKLPVLLIAHDIDSGIIKWINQRRGTGLHLWSDYHDVGESLSKLIMFNSDVKPDIRPVPSSQVIRVLFVDDSPTVRVNFRRLLLRDGYEAEVASNVEEGMELALQQYFDIAIIDYFMPDFTGDELCRRLRDDSRTHHIMCAILTGTYLDNVIKDSLNAGAVECMFKSEAHELFLARVAAMKRAVLYRKSIENERRRLDGILNSVGDGVYGVDNQGSITFMNPAGRDILAYKAEREVIGKTPHELFHYAFSDGLPNTIDACFLTNAYGRDTQLRGWETIFWQSTGRAIPVECTVYPLRIEGRREGSVIAFRDISERKLLEEELRWQANHDSLTKLLNRHYFEQQLDREVKRQNRDEHPSALLYLDLDRFKYVNDTAGHVAGDQLLIEVGNQLQRSLSPGDTLARLGGDEFAIIVRDLQSAEPDDIADGFRSLIENYRFSYEGKNYSLTASIGVANIDLRVQTPGDVLANADLSCHIAKSSGRNQIHIFDLSKDDRSAMDQELGWSARLRDALKANAFELHFQPIVPLSAINQLEGREAELEEDQSLWEYMRTLGLQDPILFEVLLRLRDDESKLISPDVFLPTAERFGMMPELDLWVLKHAIERLAAERARGRDIRFSINLSGNSLTEAPLAGTIQSLLEAHGVPAYAVTFEITETSAITNIDAAKRFIAELHTLGCKFALDDFGSGFCSFGHLKHLQVDYIKIDGLFTQGVLTDPIDRAVVQSVNDIAHSFGKFTVAEYVDNAEVIRVLKETGVDYAQGYFISKPFEKIKVE